MSPGPRGPPPLPPRCGHRRATRAALTQDKMCTTGCASITGNHHNAPVAARRAHRRPPPPRGIQ